MCCSRLDGAVRGQADRQSTTCVSECQNIAKSSVVDADLFRFYRSFFVLVSVLPEFGWNYLNMRMHRYLNSFYPVAQLAQQDLKALNL